MYRQITFRRLACALLASAIGSAMTAQAAEYGANAAPYGADAVAADNDLESQAGLVEARGRANNVTPALGAQPQFISDFSMFSGSCIVGPRAGDVIFTCFGFGFPAAFPRQVFCQTRQQVNVDFGFPDQFDCQIIRTSPGSVTFRIRRMDDGTGSSGWGQNLRADLLIIN